MTAPTASASPSRTPGHVLAVLFAVQVGFASLAIVGKVTVGVVPWPALVLLRTLGALAVFMAWGVARKEPLLPPKGARGTMLALGFLGVFANQVGFLAGLSRTTAINATVLTATIPLFTALVAVVSRREALRPRFAVGALVALAGLLLVVRPERASFGDAHLAGDALVVANSLAYGTYLAFAREHVLAHGGLAVVRWVFLAGALFALPVGLGPAVATLPGASPRVLAALAYILLVPTAFTYAANAWCLGRAPSSVVSVFIYLQPPLAAALAVAVGARLADWLAVPFHPEALTARTAVGGLATLAGVWIATRR